MKFALMKMVPLPTQEDYAIDQIANLDERLNERWALYLERLRLYQWGDHLTVQGFADFLGACIHVVATNNPDKPPVMPRMGAPHHTFCIGLAGQQHYSALAPGTRLPLRSQGDAARIDDPYPLPTKKGDVYVSAQEEAADESGGPSKEDKVYEPETQLPSTEKEKRSVSSPGVGADDGDEEENDESVDRCRTQDEEAFEFTSKLRGLPYTKLMLPERAFHWHQVKGRNLYPFC